MMPPTTPSKVATLLSESYMKQVVIAVMALTLVTATASAQQPTPPGRNGPGAPLPAANGP